MDYNKAHYTIFFFQAEDGIRDRNVTGVQTCALPIFQRIGRAVVGLVARAVAAVVEHDDRVIGSERGNVIGEVLLRTPETMNQQETRPVSRNLDRQPDTVVRRDAHVPWSRVW